MNQPIWSGAVWAAVVWGIYKAVSAFEGILFPPSSYHKDKDGRYSQYCIPSRYQAATRFSSCLGKASPSGSSLGDWVLCWGSKSLASLIRYLHLSIQLTFSSGCSFTVMQVCGLLSFEEKTLTSSSQALVRLLHILLGPLQVNPVSDVRLRCIKAVICLHDAFRVR